MSRAVLLAINNRTKFTHASCINMTLDKCKLCAKRLHTFAVLKSSKQIDKKQKKAIMVSNIHFRETLINSGI